MKKITSKKFEFEFDGTVYSMPLAPTIEGAKKLSKTGEASGVEALDWFADFSRPYLGDLIDTIDITALAEIMQAWSQEAQEAQGATDISNEDFLASAASSEMTDTEVPSSTI